MGLFDAIKNMVANAANTAKEGYNEAMNMDPRTLCNQLKDLKKTDIKFVTYRSVLAGKLDDMDDEALDACYQEIKKQGTFFKQHPAQEVLEDALVQRNIYNRDEDGVLSRNRW